MKTTLLLLICVSYLTASRAQNVNVVKWPELESVLKTPKSKPLVVNFWATWCKPCVLELPYFLESADSLKDQVDFLLVSFDFASDLDKKVKPFIQRKQIELQVMLLDETDYNSFIDKVDSRWSGAIPATILLTADRTKKTFYEKEYHNSLELISDIRNFIQSSNK